MGKVLVSSRPKRRDLATHPFCETEGGGRVDMHDVAQYIFYDVVGGIGRGLRKITNRKFSNLNTTLIVWRRFVCFKLPHYYRYPHFAYPPRKPVKNEDFGLDVPLS